MTTRIETSSFLCVFVAVGLRIGSIPCRDRSQGISYMCVFAKLYRVGPETIVSDQRRLVWGPET